MVQLKLCHLGTRPKEIDMKVPIWPTTSRVQYNSTRPVFIAAVAALVLWVVLSIWGSYSWAWFLLILGLFVAVGLQLYSDLCELAETQENWMPACACAWLYAGFPICFTFIALGFPFWPMVVIFILYFLMAFAIAFLVARLVDEYAAS
jgi:hypothetical protein